MTTFKNNRQIIARFFEQIKAFFAFCDEEVFHPRHGVIFCCVLHEFGIVNLAFGKEIKVWTIADNIAVYKHFDTHIGGEHNRLLRIGKVVRLYKAKVRVKRIYGKRVLRFY